MPATSLSLFPVRVPIGRYTDAAGKSYDVLMTPEFSRALSDLLKRVGGTNAMGNDELAALTESDADSSAMQALLGEIAALRAQLDMAAHYMALAQQIEQMRAELAMIEDPAAQVRYIQTRFASLDSPTFTGTPKAPTAAIDTNTDQLATTKFVLAQAAAANPVQDGVAAPGTSTRFARADHVHPHDSSKQDTISAGNVTGSRTGNTAVTLSILSALAGSGLIVDNTTA